MMELTIGWAFAFYVTTLLFVTGFVLMCAAIRHGKGE